MNSLIEYFEALERLKQNNTLIIKHPYTINNDTVALEAGRKRGSIKKSRENYSLLIKEIEKAKAKKYQTSNEGCTPLQRSKNQLKKSREQSEEWRKKYEAAIGRELSLLKQINDLKKSISKVKYEKH